MFPQSASDRKDEVRQATDIVDLIGSYLELRRQGRGFVALCPWHNDTRPSLQVNPERQSWKCWVCDIGGDVFSFIMRREGVDFREALELLAERAGIPLEPGRRAAPGSPDDKQMLYRAVAWAEEQFHHCLLHAAEAEEARRYLLERGLSWDSICRFRLGFSPNEWQWLLDRAATTPFSVKVLEAAGLAAQGSRSGRPYDRFMGRVIFPIRDVQGRPIAFGGRILAAASDGRTAKYINSPETRLFSKSDHVYGLDAARDAVAKSRRVVVMEGYTDVIMAHQFGVAEAVAVLGTALGPRHVRLLRRYADAITLVLDGDEAGRRRTNEVLELFIAEPVDLRILTLPDQLDPCDFLLQKGAAALVELLHAATDALEHKFRQTTHNLDPTRDVHRANQALEELLGTLSRASQSSSQQRLRQQQMLTRLSRLFSVEEEELRHRMAALRRKTPRGEGLPAPRQAPALDMLDPWERELLEILALHPEAAAWAAESISANQLTSEPARAIFRCCGALAAAGILPDLPRVMAEIEDLELKNLLVTLDEEAQAKGDADWETRLEGLIGDFRCREQQRRQRQALIELERNHLEVEEATQLLQQILDLERARHGISAPTDGQDTSAG